MSRKFSTLGILIPLLIALFGGLILQPNSTAYAQSGSQWALMVRDAPVYQAPNSANVDTNDKGAWCYEIGQTQVVDLQTWYGLLSSSGTIGGWITADYTAGTYPDATSCQTALGQYNAQTGAVPPADNTIPTQSAPQSDPSASDELTDLFQQGGEVLDFDPASLDNVESPFYNALPNCTGNWWYCLWPKLSLKPEAALFVVATLTLILVLVFNVKDRYSHRKTVLRSFYLAVGGVLGFVGIDLIYPEWISSNIGLALQALVLFVPCGIGFYDLMKNRAELDTKDKDEEFMISTWKAWQIFKGNLKDNYEKIQGKGTNTMEDGFDTPDECEVASRILTGKAGPKDDKGKNVLIAETAKPVKQGAGHKFHDGVVYLRKTNPGIDNTLIIALSYVFVYGLFVALKGEVPFVVAFTFLATLALTYMAWQEFVREVKSDKFALTTTRIVSALVLLVVMLTIIGQPIVALFGMIILMGGLHKDLLREGGYDFALATMITFTAACHIPFIAEFLFKGINPLFGIIAGG